MPASEKCLFVSNMCGPDGQWYFDADIGGWKPTLAKALGPKRGGHLNGVTMVATPNDTRLCLLCKSRAARGHLIAVLK